MRFQLLRVSLLVVTVVAAGPVSVVIADEIQPLLLMDREPAEVPQPQAWRLDPELIRLWKQALTDPQSEMKRQAAEAIAQAHLYQHDGLQSAIPELLNVLTADKVHPAARFAAAHALIVLDHRSSAATLMEVSQKDGKDLRQLVEPALAAWDVAAIRPIWRERIASSKSPRRDLILAIRGLGQQRDAAALDALLKLSMTVDYPSDVRLAAARAAGQVAHEGLEPRAEQVLARTQASVLERLCAVSLIGQHQSEQAVKIHQKLGTDSEPTIAAAALRSLFAINPKLVLPLADVALQNPDEGVRRVGIETYLTLPTPERIQTVSHLLNDPHPKLRATVRDGFRTLSKVPDLDTAIRQSATAVLAGDDWRGQEQAALLLGALDEERVAPRLMELLEVRRPETMIAAAWALKSLAIPETALPILAFAQRRADAAGMKPVAEHSDRQLAHLLELLGTLKTVEATPVLLKLVPKQPEFGENCRAAAIWALGLLQEGHPNEALSAQLMERVLDMAGQPPEAETVRRASILTLGRLRATAQVPGLKKLIGDQVDNEMIDLSMRWAILQITGEKLPIAPPPVLNRTGWFLESSKRTGDEK